MAAKNNFDDMDEEELKAYLEQHQDDDMKADLDGGVNSDTLEKKEEPTIPAITAAPKSKSIDKKAKHQAKIENKVRKKHQKEIKRNQKKKKNDEQSTVVRYTPNADFGLTTDQVNKRNYDGLFNEKVEKKTKSIPKIIYTNVVSFFNILMFIIAACLIYVKAWTDLTFLVVVTANIIIGTIQEIRAKKMIDSLSLMNAPLANVIRNGVKKEISANEIVLDDIILLKVGDTIPTDAIILSGSVEANESLLTGESNAILKNVGDVLYSGSYLVSGSCYARVDKIGKDTYIEQLSSQAKIYKKPKSDLLKSLSLIIKVMTVPVIGFGVAIFSLMFFKNNLGVVTSIRKTAGAMIGMIPSGLILMSSIALMVGVIRLAQKNVLVQDLYCIEMLARVNCICLDKTGTITDGTMIVKNVVEYNDVGIATKNIISAMLNAIGDENMTSKALIKKFGLGRRIKHTAIIPFSSVRKLQAVTFEQYGTFVLGAPEFVLKDDFKTVEKDVDRYAKLGYRVLCLAHLNGSIENNELPKDTPLIVSMLLIEDNIRPDAIKTIQYFKDSKVEVRVISGDNPITVSKIAERAGVEGADKYISLDGLDDNEVIKAALRYTVFGRVSPSQKKLIIQTLKQSGRTVAMTGDGVNDILALREADCSIAVASGSEAARNVSHLVLLDSNFGSMPYVVAEGRRVINNVSKVSSLFLTKTIFSLFLCVITLFTGSYPISTNQLFLIDTLAIGLPSLFLVYEPNNNPVKGKFLMNVIRNALPGALAILTISIIVYGLQNALLLDNITYTSIIVVSATHTCLMVLFKVCRPFNTMHKVLCTVCYGLFLFALICLPQFFELRPFANFSEYHSNTIKTETITKTPSISKSEEGYYVIDGVVSSYKITNTSDTGSTVTVISKTNDASSGSTLYYKIDGTETSIELSIPDISFDKNGHIMLGGLDVDTNSLSAENIKKFDQTLKLDKHGYLYSNEEQVYITLPETRDNEYYGYSINYGKKGVETNKFKACFMPVVKMNDSLTKFIITDYLGNSSEYTYSVPTSFSNILNGMKFDYELQYSEKYQSYVLCANGQVLMSDEVKNEKTGLMETYPYIVNLPKVSYSLDQSNSDVLYLDASNSNVSIYELYGTKTTETINNVDYELYEILDNEGNTIGYNKSQDLVFVKPNGVESYDTEAKEYEFTNVLTNSFSDYKDLSGNDINIYKYKDESGKLVVDKTNSISVTAVTGRTLYSLTKTGSQANSVITRCQLSNSQFGPNITVSKAGFYVIDGYYTSYEADDTTSYSIQKNSENYLVLNSKVTDYKFLDSDIETVTGGTVKRMSISSFILLLMVCLLSRPLIAIFQYAIPWCNKQANNIKNFIQRYKV